MAAFSECSQAFEPSFPHWKMVFSGKGMHCTTTGDFNWSHDNSHVKFLICYVHVHDAVRLWVDPSER